MFECRVNLRYCSHELKYISLKYTNNKYKWMFKYKYECISKLFPFIYETIEVCLFL